jgi:hypothetical protein
MTETSASGVAEHDYMQDSGNGCFVCYETETKRIRAITSIAKSVDFVLLYGASVVAGGLCADKDHLKPTIGLSISLYLTGESYLKMDQTFRNVDRGGYPGWRSNAVFGGI